MTINPSKVIKCLDIPVNKALAGSVDAVASETQQVITDSVKFTKKIMVNINSTILKKQRFNNS